MYNYLEAMKNDIREYIENEVNVGDYSDRDEMESELYDTLFCVDSVTGNASGSYTFNFYQAKKNVEGDPDSYNYIRALVREFSIDSETVADKFLNEDWEYWDVSIRCYLLGEALGATLDDMENAGELDTYFEEEEEEE